MATPILMPTFGMTTGEATLMRWLKEPGQPVALDEPILEVETDKATLEVPSPVAGILLRISVAAGATVPLKATVGWVGQPGDAIDMMKVTDPARTPDVSPPDERQATPVEPGDGWSKASPLARRIAHEHGLALASIPGSGPGGRVVEADVQRALASSRAATIGAEMPVGAASPAVVAPLSAARRLTAARTAESFRTAPHFYLQKELRAARLVDLRTELLPAVERLVGIRLSFTDLLVRALALVLPDHPLLNAAWSGDEITTFANIDLGIAVATAQGLVVPIIHQVGALSLLDIARRRSDIARRAKEGRLLPDELQGGTFTLTNLGMYGVDSFMPILNPPQSAILAAGAIAERPVAANGSLVLQPTLHLTLAVDHRVADGVQAALFLKDLVSLLEAPSPLAL